MHRRGEWWIPDHMKSAGNHVRRSAAIDAALAYLPGDRRRGAVQAGAHVGTWIRPLAGHFEQVYGYEPMTENFECLQPNVRELENVLIMQAGLGDRPGSVAMHYSKKNTGKHCVKEGVPGTTKIYRLDDLFPPEEKIDAIFLDIEGYELKALLGAMRIIQSCHPLILCEENGCSRRYRIADDAIEKHLATLGYTKRERWEEDVIYTHEEWSCSE